MPHFPTQEEDQQMLEVHMASQNEPDARAERIRVKNRRMRYLDIHPEYFTQSHLELAALPDPLLYDRLIRRFQTVEEREKEGRERGYSGVLEANLVRSEAKIQALQHPDPNSPLIYTRAPDGSITGVEQDESDRATSKEDGWEKWKEVMGLRFLRGNDADFDYVDVDENQEYDDREEEDRDLLEKYLDGEQEEFVGEGSPVGQTGIQDF